MKQRSKNAPRTASKSAPCKIIQQARAQARRNSNDLAKLKRICAPRSNQPHQLWLKAKAVHLAISGSYRTCHQIAQKLEVAPSALNRWVKLYAKDGLDALLTYEHGGGQKSKLSTVLIGVIESLLMFQPHALLEMGYFQHLSKVLAGRNRWNQSMMAKVIGISPSTFGEYVKRLNLTYFKGGQSDYCFSTDANFIGKLIHIDLLRLYGEQLGYEVWSFDEKTCIQALLREMAVNLGGVLLKVDRYFRKGTTNLLALMRPATGKIHANFTKEKKAKDVVAFISNFLAERPTDRKIVIIMDNLSTHGAIKQLESKFPNLIVVFTPTNASWLNPVESFFGFLAKNVLAGRSDDDIGKLQDDVIAYIKAHNESAEPVNWDFDIKRRINQRLNTWACLKRFFPKIEQLRDLGKGLLSTEAQEFLEHSRKLQDVEHITTYDNGNLSLLRDGYIEAVQSNVPSFQDALEAYHPVPSKQREALNLDASIGDILSNEVLEAYTDLKKAKLLIEKLFVVLPQNPYRNAAGHAIRKSDVEKAHAKVLAVEEEIQTKQQLIDKAKGAHAAELAKHPIDSMKVEQADQLIVLLSEQLYKLIEHKKFVKSELDRIKRKYEKQCAAATSSFQAIKDGLFARLDAGLDLWHQEQEAYREQRQQRAEAKRMLLNVKLCG